MLSVRKRANMSAHQRTGRGPCSRRSGLCTVSVITRGPCRPTVNEPLPLRSHAQVELNTIASSFGCLSTLTGALHRHTLRRSGRPEADLNRLPHNDVTAELADALGAAVREFGANGAAVLFVVQPNERNSYDQQVAKPSRTW